MGEAMKSIIMGKKNQGKKSSTRMTFKEAISLTGVRITNADILRMKKEGKLPYQQQAKNGK